jgi:hypothetical protein
VDAVDRSLLQLVAVEHDEEEKPNWQRVNYSHGLTRPGPLLIKLQASKLHAIIILTGMVVASLTMDI